MQTRVQITQREPERKSERVSKSENAAKWFAFLGTTLNEGKPHSKEMHNKALQPNMLKGSCWALRYVRTCEHLLAVYLHVCVRLMCAFVFLHIYIYTFSTWMDDYAMLNAGVTMFGVCVFA